VNALDSTNTVQGIEFVLGTAQLGTSYGISRRRSGAPQAESPDEFLAATERLGVKILDTAPAYGDAEALIGRSNCPMLVHTKVSRDSDPVASVEASLRRLRRAHVDVLYLHDSSVILDSAHPTLEAAAELVGTATRSLGVSIYEEEEMAAALRDPRIEVVQVPLNLFDRRFGRQRIAEAAELGKQVFVRSALLQGVLAMPGSELPSCLVGLRPFVDDFHRLARELDRTAIEVALGWVRSVPGVRGVVVGTASIAELEELVGAFRANPLTNAEIDAVERLPMPSRDLTDPRLWTVGR
jgi:aryl-alcohol dehydrogenase-like predicted oxidoreductase